MWPLTFQGLIYDFYLGGGGGGGDLNGSLFLGGGGGGGGELDSLFFLFIGREVEEGLGAHKKGGKQVKAQKFVPNKNRNGVMG